MTFETLLVEDRGPIRVLTINRPEKLNALNAQVMRDLDVVTHDVMRSESVRGLIITGAGDKAFVAGADIGELKEQDIRSAIANGRTGQRIMRRIETLRVPVIAAVNGFALGGGCELALACHLRVAAKSAKFGLPEVKLGIIPGYGGTQRLPRLVGSGRALEMMLSGEFVDAETALAWGLVNRLADSAAETLSVAEQLLAPIVKRGPLAVGAALEAWQRGSQVPIAEGFRIERDLFGQCFTTEDTLEGLSAFLEKRRPDFQGR